MFKQRTTKMAARFAVLAYLVLWLLAGCQPVTKPAQPAQHTVAASNSIESLEAIELGGVQQWILIRGKERTHPVLLWLHGGPGGPTMPYAHYYDTELVKHFVVVHWDQRGAGKSYDPALAPEMLTIEQYIADTVELVRHLRQRFGAAKIYLIGHSWGSQLGALTVARYPELFHAFVGVSQAVSIPETHRIIYPRLLEEARANGNQEALGELEALGSPPWSTVASIMTFAKWNAAFGGVVRQAIAEQMDIAVQQSPVFTPQDVERTNLGLAFSVEVMLSQLLQLNLLEQAPRLDVPVFFIHGQYDGASPGVLAEQYYATLEAPKGRSFVWFKESAHFPMWEEPDKFNQEMLRMLDATYPR
jgi:pimeloyl-ACP methyl ester carboxylesterase